MKTKFKVMNKIDRRHRGHETMVENAKKSGRRYYEGMYTRPCSRKLKKQR